LANKLPKTPFFTLKYLTRYTPETFLEEYINLKFFSYLRHCGVIPVQNFGSHIRLQLPGSGLTVGEGPSLSLAIDQTLPGAGSFGHIYKEVILPFFTGYYQPNCSDICSDFIF
jgi:hypothetical protein